MKMATTTKFEDWIDAVNPDDYEEIYALYNAVKNEESEMGYKCSRKGNQLFITYSQYEGPNETLLLSGTNAKEYFLEWYEKKFCKEMDIESWYGMERAINNPNA
jgi:hypothetical protein